MSEKCQWVACISGSGSTASEMIKAVKRSEIKNIEASGIISSNPEAGGIKKALEHGVPQERIIVINPQDYRHPSTQKIDQDKFGNKLLNTLKFLNADLVTLNGWMPLMPRLVVEKYAKKMFNQHPGPIPEFGGKGMYGRRVHETIIQFSRLTGRTDLWTEVIAQRVESTFDAGVVVASRRVDFTLNDDGDSLGQKALPIEHLVQIDLLKDFTENRLPEIHRHQSIIFPGQEKFLDQAKEIAFQKYPHG